MIRKLDIALIAIILGLTILFGTAVLIVQATPRTITVFPAGSEWTAVPMPGWGRREGAGENT